MPRQLLNHAKSEDWSFRRVMQNVQAHHPRVEIAVHRRIWVICFRFFHFDYEDRIGTFHIPTGKPFRPLTFS
jgi:hypothetical protein